MILNEVLRALKKHKILLFVTVIACILCLSVNAFAAETTDSSFVTTSDGKSYEGLPEFPTIVAVDTNHGTRYIKYYNYILFKDTTNNLYYLVCTGSNGSVFINDNHCFDNTGTYTQYYDSDCTNVYNEYSYPKYNVYWCGVDAASWTLKGGYTSTLDINVADTLLQSSCDIYADETLTTVFTKSAQVPLVADLSPTTIVEMMTSQMVGLVPLVIGFLICLMGFLKAWKVLSQALRTA